MSTGLVSCGSQVADSPQLSAPYFGPTFEDTLAAAKKRVEAQMQLPLIIPVPKDPGGGYTHEKHKENSSLIYDSGQLYMLTGDTRYAKFAGKIMLGYADVYPDWKLHPAKKEQSPGRMFWQNLNESMWLLNASQSYGAVKAVLSAEQRDKIETDLLRNMADFLSAGSPETFNKVHNHGTWATAAVGLTGYAIGDDNYVQQALLGLDKSGDAGFLKQMNKLFSPDGYYNEGPYYQRFALMPFVVFAQAVEKNNPEQKIFEQRDGILKKAIYTTIEQSYNGLFFPINDAIKDKGLSTRELLHGVAIAYDLTGDKGLLSIAKSQGRFVLTTESRALSNDLTAGLAKPFNYRSMRLSDGVDGTEGALDIIRSSSDEEAQTIVMKNTAQGLGHGHFDKLGLLYFNNGQEILRDYGAARFLNVEAKYGGHYLPENKSFAKQTIAHNTLIVDETSHFGGNTKIGNKYHPDLGIFSDVSGQQIASAKIDTAYPGVALGRTIAMIQDRAFAKPVIIDVMEASADESHQYDLPFYYNGQLIETNFKLATKTKARAPLGEKNGYQHLWNTASATPVDGLSQMTWLLDRTFYTISSSIPKDAKIVFAEIGANDPNFNLRTEPAMILRAKRAGGVSFVSVIETHGEYNPVAEYTVNSHSVITSVEHFKDETDTLVVIKMHNGQSLALGLSDDTSTTAAHSLLANGVEMTWTGPYHIFHSELHKAGDQ